MKLQKNLLLFLFLPFFINHCNNNFSSEGEQTKTDPPPFRRFKMLSFQENPAFSIPLEGKKEPKVAFAHLDSDARKDLMIVSLHLENQNQPDKTNQFLVSSYLSTNQSSFVFQNKIQSSFMSKYYYFDDIKQVEIVDAFFEDSKPELHIIGNGALTGTLPGTQMAYYTAVALSNGSVLSDLTKLHISTGPGVANTLVFGKLCGENQPKPIHVRSPNIMAFLNTDHYGATHNKLSDPIAGAIADFTKDGIQDLLVLNQGKQDLALVKGSGASSCYQQTICTIELPKEAKGQNGLQVADLNQDGNMDIIVSNYDSKNVSILWGQGTDVFKTFTHIDTIDPPLVMKVFDLDQDGELDIIVATSHHIKMLSPNGKIQTIASFQTEQHPIDLWIFDQNEDGKPDIWLEHMLYDKTTERFIGHLSLWINQST